MRKNCTSCVAGFNNSGFRKRLGIANPWFSSSWSTPGLSAFTWVDEQHERGPVGPGRLDWAGSAEQQQHAESRFNTSVLMIPNRRLGDCRPGEGHGVRRWNGAKLGRCHRGHAVGRGENRT